MTKQNTYVFTDLHGCCSKFKTLVSKLDLKEEDTLIFLGDYVDRGAEVKDTIQTLIDLSNKYRCIFLEGNHEVYFKDYLKFRNNNSIWLHPANGGNKTLDSYRDPLTGELDIPTTHLEFLHSLLLYYETDDYFFVHAAVPRKSLKDITPDDYSYMQWERSDFIGTEYKWDKMIIHGHTPIKEATIYPNRINIDTGAVYGVDRYLTCLKLPDLTFITSA